MCFPAGGRPGTKQPTGRPRLVAGLCPSPRWLRRTVALQVACQSQGQGSGKGSSGRGPRRWTRCWSSAPDAGGGYSARPASASGWRDSACQLHCTFCLPLGRDRRTQTPSPTRWPPVTLPVTLPRFSDGTRVGTVCLKEGLLFCSGADAPRAVCCFNLPVYWTEM